MFLIKQSNVQYLDLKHAGPACGLLSSNACYATWANQIFLELRSVIFNHSISKCGLPFVLRNVWTPEPLESGLHNADLNLDLDTQG